LNSGIAEILADYNAGELELLSKEMGGMGEM
jgi:hypothetical protein